MAEGADDVMHAKLRQCRKEAAIAYAQRMRNKFRENITSGSQRRGAAQAKRERKRARAIAQLERNG